MVPGIPVADQSHCVTHYLHWTMPAAKPLTHLWRMRLVEWNDYSMEASPLVNGASKKLWIISGEASGDTYGAELALALRRLAPDLSLCGMGGSRMRAAGVELMVDATELGVVGIIEVVKQLPLFMGLMRQLVAQAAAERPVAVVLIDYPGFNLRLARRLKQLGIPVIYYVSPQVWAWGKGRLPAMIRDLRRVLVIFPFEQPFFEREGLPATFVGHPLPWLLRRAGTTPERDPKLVILLPGSRTSELKALLEPLVQTALALHRQRPGLRFVLPTPRASLRDKVQARVDQWRATWPADFNLQITAGDTHDWLRRGSAGLAASGTVTIECAILGLPLVVVYKVNPLTFWSVRWLIKLPWFTMVNLVANEAVFEEFVQGQVRPAILAPALLRLLPGGERREQALAGMAKAVAALGAPGDRSPSETAARAVLAEMGLPI
jgi:lipid-A-disaccharide synthase